MPTLTDTGSVVGDIRELISRSAIMVSSEISKAIMPGLIADTFQDPDLSDQYRRAFIMDVSKDVKAIEKRAIERGEITAPGIPPDDLHALIMGGLYAWVYFFNAEPHDLEERLVQYILAMFKWP